jgi:PAS domain S-box-containing protein
VVIVALINNRNRLSPDPRSQAEQLAGPHPQAYSGDESQFADAFEHAAIAMALLRPDGRVLHANAALCRLLGLAHEQLREQTITDFMHTDDITTDTLARQALLSGQSASYQGERRLLRADQRLVWARLACSLTRSAAGEPSGVLLQLLEITAPNAVPETDEFLAGEMETRTRAQMMRLNAELEERVRQRTSQLQLANRELEAFSYSIAHDLRAPLSSIDGFSRALEQAAQGSLGEPNQHYLRRIRAGVKQMAELTDGLLALSSLSRGDLLHEEVDLAHLARSVVGQLSEQKSGRDVEVRIESPLPVIGDPRLLHQVMANLVGNAWKFTSRTRQARIDIGALWRKRGAAFYVRDNGAGFDLAHASRLFQAFHRMHSASEFDGNGIGLAIVQKIVLRHGGLVWAESEPGNGATFYFTLAPDIPVGP